MSASQYAAVILAGGLSSRMGQFKPLLPLGNKSVTQHLVSTFQESCVEVYLIAGHRAPELAAAIKDLNIHFVENPHYSAGMFSSVQAGIRALGMRFSGTFIAPVDIPLVRAFTIARLMEASRNSPGRLIYPFFGGRRGHPPFIPAGLFQPLLEWPGDGDLKSALGGAQGNALEVNVADRFINSDLDSPADYQRLQEDYRSYTVPSKEECRVVMEEIAKLPEGLMRHSRKVAEVARELGEGLEQAGQKMDLAALEAGALCHDLAKGRPDHEREGAGFLRRMGFEAIAPLVAAHADLQASGEPSLEAKLVFLADKLVMGDRLVSLDERFSEAMQRFGSDPAAAEDIRRKWSIARTAQNEIEMLLKRPMESVWQT